MEKENANVALSVAQWGYVFRRGRIVLVNTTQNCCKTG